MHSCANLRQRFNLALLGLWHLQPLTLWAASENRLPSVLNNICRQDLTGTGQYVVNIKIHFYSRSGPESKAPKSRGSTLFIVAHPQVQQWLARDTYSTYSFLNLVYGWYKIKNKWYQLLISYIFIKQIFIEWSDCDDGFTSIYIHQNSLKYALQKCSLSNINYSSIKQLNKCINHLLCGMSLQWTEPAYNDEKSLFPVLREYIVEEYYKWQEDEVTQLAWMSLGRNHRNTELQLMG